MPRTRAALAYAEARHRGQRREADDVPFVAHPIEVAALLEECGYTDPVIAAAVLHDVLEDTDAERQELEEQFGAEIATLVAALTDDPSIGDEAERKAALRLQVAQAGEPVPAIFAADKISKAREVRLLASRQQVDGSLAVKVEHHQESLEMLEQTIPGHELVQRLRTEIDALESQLELQRPLPRR
jgi:(p)ppGpp synthase/HD superfamily hydrolase